MKLLFISLTIFCFTLPFASSDLAEWVEKSTKCGEEMRAQYKELCKKFGNKGENLQPIEAKCVKTPEALKDFPVSESRWILPIRHECNLIIVITTMPFFQEVVKALQNCKKPDMFCKEAEMEAVSRSKTNYHPNWLTDGIIFSLTKSVRKNGLPTRKPSIRSEWRIPRRHCRSRSWRKRSWSKWPKFARNHWWVI